MALSLRSFFSESGRRSRRRGTLGYAACVYVLTGLSLVQGVALVPLYLRHINELLYGAWLASGSILTHLGLFDFGINTVIIQKVAESYGAGDLPRLSRYLSSSLVLSGCLSLLPGLVGTAGAFSLPRLISVPPGEAHTLVTAFIIASCSVSVLLNGHALGGILCALQWQTLHGLIWVAATSMGLVVTVILLVSGYGLLSLAWGELSKACLVLLLEAAAFWQLRQQILPGVSLALRWESVKELLKPSGAIFLASLGTNLANHSDNFLVGIFLGSRGVLVYDLTKRAFGFLWMLMGRLVAVFAPALAHFFGEMKELTGEARGLTDMLLHVGGAACLVLMGGYVILDQAFVGLWVGRTFYAGDGVVLLIGIYGILATFSLTLYHIVFARGQIYLVAISRGSEGLLRVPMVAALGWWLGLFGVALAGVVSLAATGCWILWSRYRRDFWVSGTKVWRHLLPLALAAAGIVAVGLVFRGLPRPATVMSFLYYGLAYLVAASFWVVLVDGRLRALLLDVCRGRPLAFFRAA